MVKIKRPFLLSVFTILISLIALMLDGELLLCVFFILLCIAFVYFTLTGMLAARNIMIIVLCIILSTLAFKTFTLLYENDIKHTGTDKEINGIITAINYDEQGVLHDIVLSSCTVDNKNVNSKITVYTDSLTDISYCDKITFTCRELFTSDNNGIFRYHSLSKRLVLYCFPSYGCEFSVEKSDKNIYSAIMNLRDCFAEKLRTSLKEENSAIATALITGSTSQLSDKSALIFRICGISHIFAVSGMHLSIWTGFFFMFFRFRAKSKFIPNAAAIIFVLFYIVFTGFSPSVLRAGIMLLCVFTGKLIKREADTLNTLGIAGTVLLLFNPFLAGNVSFLLSFTATAAIILWNDYVFKEKTSYRGRLQFIVKKLKKYKDDLLVSVAVILTTLPVSSLFFGYISLISPVVSLVVTPLAEGVMIFAFLTALCPSDNIISEILCLITDKLCYDILKFTELASEIEFSVLPVNSYIVLPCFIVTLILSIYFITFKGNRKRAIAVILTGTLIFTALSVCERLSHNNETSVFIAGGTNSTMISVVMPSDNYALIYGAGGTYSQISQTSSFLSSKGILKADILFLPRATITESENAEYIKNTLLPDKTVNVSSKRNDGEYFIQIRDDACLQNRTTEDFAASVLEIDGIKTVICTLPSSDFSVCDEIYRSGDILICRNSIPESVDTESFTDIIIMTDKDEKYTDPYISTKNGSIEIVIKGDSYAINR